MTVQLCSLNPLTEHFTGTKVLTLFILFGVCLTMLDHYFCTNESKIYLMSKGNICITHVISTIKCTLSNNNNTFYLKAKKWQSNWRWMECISNESAQCKCRFDSARLFLHLSSESGKLLCAHLKFEVCIYKQNFVTL